MIVCVGYLCCDSKRQPEKKVMSKLEERNQKMAMWNYSEVKSLSSCGLAREKGAG